MSDRRRNGANGQWSHKLTEEIIAKAVLATKAGVPARFIGPYCGVDRATFFRWLQNGNDGGKPLERKLAADIEMAQSEYVVNAVANVTTNGTPRDIIEMLARRFPEEFGRKDHLVTEGRVEHRHVLEPTGLTDEELATYIALTRKAIAARDDQHGELLQLPRGETG